MKSLRTALVTLLTVPLVALAAPPAPAKPSAKPAAASQEAKTEAEGECHHPPLKDDAAAAATKDSGWTLTRGEALKGATALTLAELLAKPQAHDGKTVRLEGKVRKACERKGCWMELAEGDKGAGVRVTFKDYGFFVPLDSAGAMARVEGVVKVTALSEATAKHYTSEGATVPRSEDGQAREVQLVASGVELRR